MTSRKKCRVAILMLRDNPFHKLTVTYFIDCLENAPPDIYEYSIIMHTYGYELALKNRIQKLFLDKYDVLIPIGEVCTTATKEALDEFGGHPTIFIGVFNAIKLNLIQSIEIPGGYVTGVTREYIPLENIVSWYLLLKPTINSIVIPYLPIAAAGILFEQVIKLKKLFAEHGIQVFAAPIERTQESIFEALDAYRSRVQSVLCLEGCFSNAFQEEIAYYCWKNYLLFCGSGVTAISNGAACAFAGEVRHCATTAYQMLRAHWEQNTPISTIPVVIHPDNQEFFVNTDMLRKIKFPEDKITELENNPSIKVVRKWINSPE